MPNATDDTTDDTMANMTTNTTAGTTTDTTADTTAGTITIRVLRGSDAAFASYLDDLARLRIAVFREFPYLYDGDLDYERDYLRIYTQCADSVVVVALDGSDVVGVSTGLPLDHETEECQRPFVAAQLDPGAIFYCGESVLLPAYRGRGLYRRFFAGREQHARALGRFERMVFCAVERTVDHPRRPPDHVPLDGAWTHFGYHRRADLVTTFEWKDIDEDTPSAKRMVFWEKQL